MWSLLYVIAVNFAGVGLEADGLRKEVTSGKLVTGLLNLTVKRKTAAKALTSWPLSAISFLR